MGAVQGQVNWLRCEQEYNALTIVDKRGKVVYQLGKVEDIEPDTPDEQPKPVKQDAPAKVEVVKKIPAPKNPVKDYVANELVFMGQMFQIADKDELLKKFCEMRKALIDAKIIDDVDSDHQTMEQAKAMFDAIYKNFNPAGNQVKVG